MEVAYHLLRGLLDSSCMKYQYLAAMITYQPQLIAFNMLLNKCVSQFMAN